MLGEDVGKFIEQVWREGHGKRTSTGGGASGGGVSTKFRRPNWQKVEIKSLNKGSIDGRVVPDVAALAGPPWYDLVWRGADRHRRRRPPKGRGLLRVWSGRIDL